MLSEQLLKRYPIITDQVEKHELKLILDELEKVASESQQGAVVEMGCYAGTTSLFIQRLLDEMQSTVEFHVYDSFEGLPEKSAKDSSPAGMQFKAGELAVSKQTYINNFKKAGLELPVIHKGWFSDMMADDIPEDIVFAFLDGDYYDSIMDSLKLIAAKLGSGSVVIVDDYQSEALPGARKAVDDWLQNNKDYALKVSRSLAIIRIN